MYQKQTNKKKTKSMQKKKIINAHKSQKFISSQPFYLELHYQMGKKVLRSYLAVKMAEEDSLGYCVVENWTVVVVVVGSYRQAVRNQHYFVDSSVDKKVGSPQDVHMVNNTYLNAYMGRMAYN
jgi:hypothetical protein